MQRYFVPLSGWTVNEVVISGDDAHHINKVMRYKEGDRIICNEPSGSSAICIIIENDNNTIRATIEKWLEESSELPVNITIAQGLPKGDKFDLVVQKGTELGARYFIPFQADRSVALWDSKKEAKKITRLSKIAKEAAEQCHRNRLPEIKKAMKMNELIQESLKYDVKLFAYEEEAKTYHPHSFGEKLRQMKSGQNIMVCIGPEGGFSNKEVLLLGENGFSPVRLGPRILRTETASLFILSSISCYFEELRCE